MRPCTVSGTIITEDYLGQESLQSYAPMTVSNLHWVMIAKIDTAEAFAPIESFTKKLVLSTMGIIFLVCLASMFLSRLFVKPIHRLEDGARRAVDDVGVDAVEELERPAVREQALDRLLLTRRDAAAVLDWAIPAFPLKGGEIVARGIAAGPEVARILQSVEARWIAEGFPGKERVQVLLDEALAP